MGLLAKAMGRYERGANYELGQSLSSHAVGNIFGSGGDNIEIAVEYSGYAWKAIDIRATTLSGQDLFVERRVGDKWVKDEAHEFNAVLEGGESQEDLSDLLEKHEKSLCLYGESFWYLSKGEIYAKPKSIYLLNPNHITVMVSGEAVTGYVYQNEGDRITFDTDEIEHYRYHDSRNRFRGTGPMQSAGWFIKSARYVQTYVNNFLENNAIPAGVVVAKSDVNEDDWRLFKSEWISKYGGIDNIGKTGFVRGSDLDFVKTGLSLGEVDFDKVKNSSRNDIMMMFGISKPMAAIFDDINRASATVARQLFAINVIQPALMKLTRKLTKDVKNWYGQEYRVASTNPIPEDAEEKINLYDKAVGRFITVNEARVAYGLEPIAGGDVIDETKKPVAEPSKSLGKITIRTKANKAELTYEMKESFRSDSQELQEKYEAQIFKAANTVLKGQKQRVLDQIKPKKLVDAKFDEVEEAELLTGATLPIMLELAKDQGELAAEFAGSADSVFKLDAVSKKYVTDSLTKASLGFSEETQGLIAKAISEGVADGESFASISKRIDNIYKDVIGVETPGYRIERLTRTEVIKTSNQMTVVAYKQSGVVSKKEWISNPGACEFCAALNGSIIQLDSTFVPLNGTQTGANGGTRANTYESVKHPPNHPACRCGLAPVITNEN